MSENYKKNLCYHLMTAVQKDDAASAKEYFDKIISMKIKGMIENLKPAVGQNYFGKI